MARNPAAVAYEGYRILGDKDWYQLSDDEKKRWWSVVRYQGEVARKQLKAMEEGRF